MMCILYWTRYITILTPLLWDTVYHVWHYDDIIAATDAKAAREDINLGDLETYSQQY